MRIDCRANKSIGIGRGHFEAKLDLRSAICLLATLGLRAIDRCGMHERLLPEKPGKCYDWKCLRTCAKLSWHSLAKINWSLVMRSIASTVFLFACLPSIIIADPATECGGSSQVEIGACVADALQRVDATIEIYLGFAISSAAELDQVTGRSAALPTLEAAQAAWSAYRDEHCDYVGATFGGGSGTGIGINSCKIELGRNRAEELMRYVQ